MFELRRDPIVGRQVLIAENRAGRPNDFSAKKPLQSSDTSAADCPFCAGHERQTPHSILEVSDTSGDWQVRAVPNKYPAVSLDQVAVPLQGSSVLESVAQPSFGAHEVIIESPRHVQDITELSSEEFARVLRVYRQRLRDWSSDERIEYVHIFKNVGVAAGASLEHVHSQLVALPDIPPAMLAELASAEYYWSKHRRNIFSQLVEEELSHRQRFVAEDESFVAFCAYAGRQPYETWILPREQQACFQDLDDDESSRLSILLRKLVSSLQKRLSPLSYNLVLHTSPTQKEVSEFYRWHLELIPRSTQLAGFEWGTGMHINPLSPERAAEILRAGV